MSRKFLSGLDLANQKIISIADGTSANDAASWGQVQAFIAGLNWKDSVRAASTGTVTLTSPGTTLDGVTLASGDRILLKNQTTASENGVYVWTASGSALTRATDMDVAAETKAATVFVREGTVNADTAWTMTTDNVTLGTTGLTWVQFGGGGTYTAASTGGLTLSAGAFSVLLPASSGLIKDATGLYIDKSIVMTRFSQSYGDGAATSYTITHNLGTKDVQVQVYDNTTPFAQVEPDIQHTTTNTVTLVHAVAPTSNQYRYRVVVMG